MLSRFQVFASLDGRFFGIKPADDGGPSWRAMYPANDEQLRCDSPSRQPRAYEQRRL